MMVSPVMVSIRFLGYQLSLNPSMELLMNETGP